MPDGDEVLRVLADADVDLVVVNDRRGDEVVARALAAELVKGVFRIAIELPKKLAIGVERVNPAVAAGKDDLRLSLPDRVGRIGPLSVLNELAAIDKLLDECLLIALLGRLGKLDGGVVVLPEHFAVALVDLDEARRFRRRDIDVAFIDAVGGHDPKIV